MNGRTRCMIAGLSNEEARQLDYLGRQTGALEVRWKADTAEECLEMAGNHRPDAVVVRVGEGMSRAVAALSADFPGIYILAFASDGDPELLRTMQAGAHDFLPLPLREIDLRIASERIARFRSRRGGAAESPGRIVSVFSNKGGNGTTTIAVHLAEALVRHHGKKVVVADLVLAHGDVTMFFNVNPSYSFADLAANADKADADFLQSLLVRHESGVHVLADPPSIEDGEQISSDQVRKCLGALRGMFDYVIVDTPHQFDERTLAALEMSDVILLVSLLNLPSMKNTQRSLELFGRLGFLDQRVKLVLSRYLPNEEISRESIEGIMNCPIFFSVPNDYPAVISAVNRGKLLPEIVPDKEITDAFRQMAGLLAGPETVREAPPRKRGLLERIFRAERKAAS